jgi:hypothetical protein
MQKQLASSNPKGVLMHTLMAPPDPGQIVEVRQRQWVVQENYVCKTAGMESIRSSL